MARGSLLLLLLLAAGAAVLGAVLVALGLASRALAKGLMGFLKQVYGEEETKENVGGQGHAPGNYPGRSQLP